MIRSRKKNQFNKSPTPLNWNDYRIQRNKCTRLICEAKKSFYGNLDLKTIRDNKTFWKVVKPIFSEKGVSEKLCALNINGDIIENKHDIAEHMNDYFVNITSSLDIDNIPGQDMIDVNSTLEDIFEAYKDHPSILSIKNSGTSSQTMSFRGVDGIEMRRYIQNLKEKVSSPEGVIPVKVLKQTIEEYADVLTDIFGNIVYACNFPNSLKSADVTPLFKKGVKVLRDNYRPVSKLPAFSKVFERIIYDQLYEFMNDRMSPLISGFRKGYSAQHALLLMLHNIQRQVDEGKVVAAVLMDLSKAFDCMDHALLLAKLQAYGLSVDALRMIQSYLTNLRQRVVMV